MDIEDFFEEWDEDHLAKLLEDNERAVNTLEAEDSEDEDVKMKARAKMITVRLNAASAKSGII